MNKVKKIWMSVPVMCRVETEQEFCIQYGVADVCILCTRIGCGQDGGLRGRTGSLVAVRGRYHTKRYLVMSRLYLSDRLKITAKVVCCYLPQRIALLA